MLWIGIAAGVMGVAHVRSCRRCPPLVQALVFALLAIAACTVYWRFIRPLAEHRNDQPLLNRRGEQLVGQRFVIVEPIVNGRGKVRSAMARGSPKARICRPGRKSKSSPCDGTTLKVRVAG